MQRDVAFVELGMNSEPSRVASSGAAATSTSAPPAPSDAHAAAPSRSSGA